MGGKMSQYLIPVTDAFVEEVARAIARDRLVQDASRSLKDMAGIELDSGDLFEDTIDRVFQRLWDVDTPANERQKDSYRSDAKAAIRAINLKLLMSSE